MKNLFAFLFAGISSVSCNSSVNRLFTGNRSPHEIHAQSIRKDPRAEAWLSAAKTSVLAPTDINIPFQIAGSFPPDKPRAIALSFELKTGQQLNVTLAIEDSINKPVYADLFLATASGSSLNSIEKDANEMTWNAEVPGKYILRIQPALNYSGDYSLVIRSGPSLGFPVSGKSRIGGVWGDARDGGARKHEGIDIFAPKRTPAIAAADGYITSVRDGGLGGKTVNLRVSERNLSLYYAHLDEQLVHEGDRVRKGDTLGLIGNTGNAAGMSPHLHFGIYTSGGAIDALPFVNPTESKLAPLKKMKIGKMLKVTQDITSVNGTVLKALSTVIPLGITTSGYIVATPDDSILHLPFNYLK